MGELGFVDRGGRLGQRQVQHVAGNRVERTADRRPGSARVDRAGQGPGVTGVGDEDHLQVTLARLHEPLVELVVEEPLASLGPLAPESTEQQHLVASVAFGAGHSLRLLSAVPGVGQHEGVARARSIHERLPLAGDARAGRGIVFQHDEVPDAGPVERPGDVPRIVHRTPQVLVRHVLVDADHQAADRLRLGAGCSGHRDRAEGDEHGHDRSRARASAPLHAHRMARGVHRISSTRRSICQRSSRE